MSQIDKDAKQAYDKYFIDPTVIDFSPMLPASPYERRLCMYYITHEKQILHNLRNYVYCNCCNAWYTKTYIKKHNATQKHKEAKDLQFIRLECRI